MLDRLYALEVFGIKLGLENIRALCAALGHPERAFAALHVAGTNGKGSVTAMVHAALVEAGLHAARYTSPHLVQLNERFVIGAAPVDQAPLAETAGAVLDCADALVAAGTLPAPPTFFEATTAIAFELFRRAGVEIAVIEVGLGGRFDATNVIEPLAGAITSIARDHEAQLGSSLDSIAFEKAGIIKPGLPVVMGRLHDHAARVIEEVARERSARLVRADEGVRLAQRMENGRTTVSLQTPEHDYGDLVLALRGAHQVDNALVAVRLMETARACGVRLGFDAIAAGITRAEWPARLELIALERGSVLLDGAHNPEGTAALAAYLARWHPERPPLVFGVMRDKDVDEMLRALLPCVGTVVCTAPPLARALEPAALAERARAQDPRRRLIVEADPHAALDRALDEGPMVCVAGSILLAGAVRERLRRRAILP